jgi:hypothetical protein
MCVHSARRRGNLLLDIIGRTNAEYLAHRIHQYLNQILYDNPVIRYRIIGEEQKTPLRDDLLRIIPGIGRKFDVDTDIAAALAVHSVHKSKLDYLPEIHVTVAGGVMDNLFIPLQMEYLTILDNRSIPSMFAIENKGEYLEPETHPIVPLLLVDKRLQKLLDAIPFEHEAKRSQLLFMGPVALTRERTLKLEFPFRGQIGMIGDDVYVGVMFIPNLKPQISFVPDSLRDKLSKTKFRIWSYDIEPLIFEVFARLAYYTNYLNYPHNPKMVRVINKLLTIRLLEQYKTDGGSIDGN